MSTQFITVILCGFLLSGCISVEVAKEENLPGDIKINESLDEIKAKWGEPDWENAEIFPQLYLCTYEGKKDSNNKYFISLQTLNDDAKRLNHALLTKENAEGNIQTYFLNDNSNWETVETKSSENNTVLTTNADPFIKNELSFIQDGMDIVFIARKLNVKFDVNMNSSSQIFYFITLTDQERKYALKFTSSGMRNIIETGTINVIEENKQISYYYFDRFLPDWKKRED